MIPDDTSDFDRLSADEQHLLKFFKDLDHYQRYHTEKGDMIDRIQISFSTNPTDSISNSDTGVTLSPLSLPLCITVRKPNERILLLFASCPEVLYMFTRFTYNLHFSLKFMKKCIAYTRVQDIATPPTGAIFCRGRVSWNNF